MPNTPCFDPPEATCTVIWPTIGAHSIGRLAGRWIDIRPNWDRLRVISRSMAGLTIPITLCVFCWNLLPYVCRRYRITNRRVIIEKGYSAAFGKSIAMEEFDNIEVQTLPGQAWLRSGDLVFLKSGQEVFRLSGVGYPATRREAILRIRFALLSVRSVIESGTIQPAGSSA